MSGRRKRLSTARRTKEGKLGSECFAFTWKEKLQMKSASEDDKPFLVELIQTVISTVETRHRHPIPPSRVTHLGIYIFFLFFFSSVLLHSLHVPGLLMYTEGSSRLVCPPPSKLFLCGYGGGGRVRSIMLLGQ